MRTGDESAVSIRAIATAVGVTPPSIYLHFADKDELILAVCEAHFARLDSRMEEAARDVADPVEALRRRAHAYVEFGVQNPEPYRILLMGKHHEVTREEVLDANRPAAAAFTHLVEAVQRCIDSGAFAPADPFLVAAGLWAVVHGITSLRITVPGFPLLGETALVDHVLDVQARGLAPPRG